MHECVLRNGPILFCHNGESRETEAPGFVNGLTSIRCNTRVVLFSPLDNFLGLKEHKCRNYSHGHEKAVSCSCSVGQCCGWSVIGLILVQYCGSNLKAKEHFLSLDVWKPFCLRVGLFAFSWDVLLLLKFRILFSFLFAVHDGTRLLLQKDNVDNMLMLIIILTLYFLCWLVQMNMVNTRCMKS